MKPANRPATLAAVVQGGLCTSCGICASIDPRIDMRLAPNGHLRPHLPDDVDPALVEVCPGATVIGPDPQALDAGTTLDPVWGPRRAMHRAWAMDPTVRHTAAAVASGSGWSLRVSSVITPSVPSEPIIRCVRS